MYNVVNHYLKHKQISEKKCTHERYKLKVSDKIESASIELTHSVSLLLYKNLHSPTKITHEVPFLALTWSE